MTHTLGPAPSFIVVGLALFSMFFGSGNLIFPLMLGCDAGSSFLYSALGFILTAVFIPLIGVVAIAYAKGNYDEIFAKSFGGKIKTSFIFLVLVSFVPLGAGPRCVVLAHASLKNFMPMPPLFIFSAIFLGLVAYLVHDRFNLLDVLGKILTPMLIICIAIMVFSAVRNGQMDLSLKPENKLFLEALMEGYNTQDLLSALFFSSSLIFLIRPYFNRTKDLTLTILKGSVISISLLTLIYVSLIGAASLHNDILKDKSGIDLISILAQHTMGDNFGLIAGLAVALACLTTAVALIMAMSDFLRTHFLSKNQKNWGLFLSLISVFFTSLIEFEEIRKIISLAMKIIYPLILLIVIRYLISYYFTHKKLPKHS